MFSRFRLESDLDGLVGSFDSIDARDMYHCYVQNKVSSIQVTVVGNIVLVFVSSPNNYLVFRVV